MGKSYAHHGRARACRQHKSGWEELGRLLGSPSRWLSPLPARAPRLAGFTETPWKPSDRLRFLEAPESFSDGLDLSGIPISPSLFLFMAVSP